jgi:uridine kinase
MTAGADSTRELLDGLVDEFLQHYRRGRTIIAVDGAPTVTDAFADSFAARLGRGGHGVFRASLDDFRLPSGVRTPSPDPDASLDVSLLRRALIEPFRLGGSTGFVLVGFDAARDIPVEPVWTTGPEDATLIVDGPGMLRPELRGLWNWSVGVAPTHGALLDIGASALVALEPWPRRVFADRC